MCACISLTVSNVFEAIGVKILPVYSVSQTFVSFMHYITFDQNFILHEISRRFLFLNRVHVFNRGHAVYLSFFFLSYSVAVEGSGIQHVDPQMIYLLSFFITWCAGASPTSKHYLFSSGS